MRFITTIIAPAAVAMLAASVAQAADTERYRLEKSESGYVRMDTQTGEMSICEERAGQLVCKLAADERKAYQDQADRLQSELKALDERVAALEKSPLINPKSVLPTDEEFEKTMGYMERFMRRFMGIAKDLDQDNKTPGVQPSDPNKT
jgi:flagellar motility protein MotE (MotC chaperone)